MYFEIAAISAVIVFAILAFFIIRTLLALQKTLKRVDELTLDLDLKIKRFDSTFNAISNIGDICEQKTAHVRNDFYKKDYVAAKTDDYSDDLAELLVAGIKIGTKIITRRK